MKTYLGQKGYTVSKKDLTDKQKQQIIADLTAKPLNGMSPSSNDTKLSKPTKTANLKNTFGMSMSDQFYKSFIEEEYGYANRGSTQEVKIPFYRESDNKFYLPLYYGESKFGPPQENKLPQGHNIDVEFRGSLREIQVPVVQTYLQHIASRGGDLGGGGLLELECAFGKTVLSLYLIAALKKKTIVIVNKEFLMNQWIERIAEFLPEARVGKIQGSTIDIEDKDIVIGMLQTLSMKTLPADVFYTFGFTIIDEVHHISSEVFSAVLFRIVTKYTLGLSATMERKDGMTKYFKMFLGDVVYKGKRDDQFDVEVRAMRFIEKNDMEFNKVLLDGRGKVQFSSMISKLCAHKPRSDFILQVLEDLLLSEQQQLQQKQQQKQNHDSMEDIPKQIMILAHNKNLLVYLHDEIERRNMASVGYYVGGMHKNDLKASESCKVIIATYSMAAEALDIKTLNVLIMATPKKDIEQAVGRILRDVRCSPIVVDITDEHAVFQNQWRERKNFYKKNHYKIMETTSIAYLSDKRSCWVRKSGFEDVSQQKSLVR